MPTKCQSLEKEKKMSEPKKPEEPKKPMPPKQTFKVKPQRFNVNPIRVKPRGRG
jgi:hypothetical protein